ncbi:unnamed protein product [Symbiodinium microadriaticum]|nr:unnamed protein product [Symbiodinium microadriaticum]CAE7639712.1 unnamed protein product [Symbiodinium sp. KB8]
MSDSDETRREEQAACRWALADVAFPDTAENAESSPGSCEDVAVDCPRPVETVAAAFGRSLAAEADATRRLLDADDLPTCAQLRLPLPVHGSEAAGQTDRYLELVDDVASMRHQLSLMATRLDVQESLIDWLKDRDRDAREEKMRLLALLRTQAAVLDEQKQQISALSEVVSRLRNDFYSQAIDRALARTPRSSDTTVTGLSDFAFRHGSKLLKTRLLKLLLRFIGASKKRRTECSDWKAGAIAFKVVRRKADVSWEDQRSKEHDRALARWLLVISRWDDCWPDLEIVKAMASISDNEGRKDSLLDWLHPRAPATLTKRVNSILLYHKEVGWGQDVVPYREHSVYCYMRDAKAGGAKPSQLASLREALIFVRFVFDVPSLDPIVKSRRILGITRRRRGAKRGRSMSLCIWSSVLRDGKASGLNLLCGLIEHFTLHGVDVIAATLICLLKLARERRGRLLGKTYDLVSAYKQFPVHEEDRNVLRTGVMNTDTGDVAVFGSNVLSFGATGSVAGFLRISAALWHAGARRFQLCERRTSRLLDHVENAPPLRINVASGRTFFLFTDGSYEPSGEVVAGIGGILYDDAGMPVSFFSGSVHPSDLEVMLETSSHPIYEIELYAVLAAFRCWGSLLKDSFTVAYIDNSAAQTALVAGSSGTDLGSRIVELIGEAESSVLCRPWYSWVPTHSNPADPPSKRHERLKSRGGL